MRRAIIAAQAGARSARHVECRDSFVRDGFLPVPDSRTHRGAHTDDERCFGGEALGAVRQAARDYAWLLNRGYARQASLKLVGDRFELNKRQRVALARATCSDKESRDRALRELPPGKLSGQTLLVDGFNVLVTFESALGGGIVLACRDGCYRDLASMHGTYRRVAETATALRLAGEALAELGVAGGQWYFDSPVSNSGRLKTLALQIAAENDWSWQVVLDANPDRRLIEASDPIASADSAVLDRCGPWFNLARYVVERRVPQAWVVNFVEPVAGDA
jgi:hypothetical protein